MSSATRFSMDMGQASVEVDATTGARITSCRSGATELLSGPSIHPSNYGATFWTSPQAAWEWPPVAAVDSAAYEVVQEAGDALLFRGPMARVGSASFRISKRFEVIRGAEAGGAGVALRVTYLIENTGSEPARVAPWEITGVPAGGLSFYPRGDGPAIGRLQLQEVDGIAWYEHTEWKPGQDEKCGTDGREGWVAHVVRQPGAQHLLLKQFADVPFGATAPEQGEVELFGNHDGQYVEVEQQGAYEELNPGASSSWPVLWKVQQLPGSVDVQVGSGSLLACARELL